MYEINVNTASALLAQGKRGTCGMFRREDGNVDFIGCGCKGPVLMLVLKVNGEVYDQKTYPYHLIAKKNGQNRSGWFVISDTNWKQLYSSENQGVDFCCIAFVKPTKAQIEAGLPGNENVPIAIKMKFNGIGQSIAIAHDSEICRLWEIEAQEMIGCVQLETRTYPCLEEH